MKKFLINFQKAILYAILKDCKGTVIYCDFCGSPLTSYSGVNKEETNERVEVNYNIECCNCGAKGRVKETWYTPTSAKEE